MVFNLPNSLFGSGVALRFYGFYDYPGVRTICGGVTVCFHLLSHLQFL